MQVLDFKAGIDFGVRGNLQEFDPAGFSPVPDNVSTWSEAYLAELLFRLPPVRTDLRFIVEVFPYLADGHLTRQDCWVYINGLFVHYQAVRTPLDMMFTASRELFSPRANRLSFALPNAMAPKELGLGEDLRLLGLAFVRLSAGDAAAPMPTPRPQPAARGPAPPQPASGNRAEPTRPEPAAGGAASAPASRAAGDRSEPAAGGAASAPAPPAAGNRTGPARPEPPPRQRRPSP